MNLRCIATLSTAALWAGTSTSHALPTPLGTAFTYQGQLKSAGSPYSGTADFTFVLFDAAAAGAAVGSPLAVNAVIVTNGTFTASLDFGALAFNGNDRWLEIAVHTPGSGGAPPFTTLSPRQQLTAAPHALYALQSAAASDATQLNGQSATFYQNASNLNAGTLGSAMLSGAYGNALTLSNAGNVFTGAFNGTFSGGGLGLTNVNANLLDGLDSTAFLQSIPMPLDLSGSSATHIIRGTNSSSGSGSIGVAGVSSATSGTTSGVFGVSASPTGRGVFGQNTATTGFGQGGRFESVSSAGIGIVGYNSAGTGNTYGGFFQSDSDSGVGVAGIAAYAQNGDAVGGYFSASGGYSSGIAAYNSAWASYWARAGYFERSGPWGYGIEAIASATSGGAFGVKGETAGPEGGTGVYGVATSPTGTTYGVYGQSNSTSGRGVLGIAGATSGDARGVQGVTNSTSGLGTVGYATASSGTTYGIYGQVNSPAGYALWGSGNFACSGSKAFRIDHPDDPANKYLLHYSAESPEVINFYSGKVIIDSLGEAVVELPRYFAKINKDPRYTLTAVGASMPNLYVAVEIDDAALLAGEAAGPGEAALPCWFRIAGGVPGAKVCWRVEAVRNDRYVQQRGAPVEIDKQGLEIGTYQQPDLYGQPQEKGLNYDAERERHAERPAMPSGAPH